MFDDAYTKKMKKRWNRALREKKKVYVLGSFLNLYSAFKIGNIVYLSCMDPDMDPELTGFHVEQLINDGYILMEPDE